MFYPQEMTEIEIIAPAKDLIAITKVLSGQGIFSQTDVNYLGSDKNHPQANLWQEKAAAYSILERRLHSILLSLGVEKTSPLQKDYDELNRCLGLMLIFHNYKMQDISLQLLALSRMRMSNV